jgi:hypothetical protein
MADPREVVSHVGIGFFAETFLHDDTIVYSTDEEGGSEQVGLAVTIESSNTVSLVGDGENVAGKLIKVEPGGVCVVQTGGTVELPGGDGATLTPGTQIVGDLGAASAEGYIRSAASATAAELIVARGQIIDATTATAVVVRLESGASN